MPLQIRRGLDSERETAAQPFAKGELILSYSSQNPNGTLNDVKLYVGDGVTQGGIQVSGFDASNVIDTIGGALLAGVHQNITFTYGEVQSLAGRIDATVSLSDLLTDLDLNNYDIVGTGNIDITGLITANFKGNVYGSDTSTLVDADANVLRGRLIGNLVGDVKGSVFGDDSTVIVDGVSGELRGKLIGSVVGDVRGSVFADDSSMLVDSTNGRLTGSLYGDVHTNNIYSGVYLDIQGEGATATVVRRYMFTPGNHTSIYAVTNGDYSTGENAYISRGSIDTPTTVIAGDRLEAKVVTAHDGTSYVPTSFVANIVDPFGTVSTGAVPGGIVFTVLNDGNPLNITKTLFMDSRGYVGINNGITQPKATLDVNGFAKLAVLTAAPASPENGMVAIADGSSWNPAGTGKSVMVVYLGGGWRVAATAP